MLITESISPIQLTINPLILTKQGSRREDMDSLMEKNVFEQAQNKDNLVKFVNDEISIKNMTIK